MSQKIIYHINKQVLNHRERILSFNCNLEPSAFNESDDILSSRKSSLETLLALIKNCQLDYISNKSSKKSYLSNTKQILSFLKDNLKSNLNEKNKAYDFLKNKNELRKKELQEKIFSESVNMTDMGSDVAKINYTCYGISCNLCIKLTHYFCWTRKLNILCFAIIIVHLYCC